MSLPYSNSTAPSEKKTLNLQEEQSLRSDIAIHFKNRTLYKGVSEVLKAVVTHRPISFIYLCGDLDATYKNAIYNGLKQVKSVLVPVVLEKKYEPLVYEVIREIDLHSAGVKPIPRRYFKSRAFAF